MQDWAALLKRFFSEFMVGAGVTLELTAVGLLIGLVLGLGLALARAYGPFWLRSLAIGYIELFRGTPFWYNSFNLLWSAIVRNYPFPILISLPGFRT